MASYFDVSEETHLAYLQPELRDRSDLEALVAEAELMVVQHFMGQTTVRDYLTFQGMGTNKRHVGLVFYTEDADDCTDGTFKTAFAMTVAKVAKKLAEGKDRETGIKSHSIGDESISYAKPEEGQGRGLYVLLDPYDIRTPPFVL